MESSSSTAAAAPLAERAATRRTSRQTGNMPGIHTWACGDARPNWHVAIALGDSLTGLFEGFLTTAEARVFAAALIAAADHYDAETARLAQAGVR